MKIDIYDIPMNELTKQYLKFHSFHEDLGVEVAAEYLVMATNIIRKLLGKNKNQNWKSWMKTTCYPRDQLVQHYRNTTNKENAKA